jgi:hypothetical protein
VGFLCFGHAAPAATRYRLTPSSSGGAKTTLGSRLSRPLAVRGELHGIGEQVDHLQIAFTASLRGPSDAANDPGRMKVVLDESTDAISVPAPLWSE